MSNFDLKSTGNTNLQTTFRFEIFFPQNTALGIYDSITTYSASVQIPKAFRDAIIWNMPMGMQNHQPGKGTVQPIQTEFFVPTNAGGTSGSVLNNSSKPDYGIYNMLEAWSNAVYNLNDGTSLGKSGASMDGIKIMLKDESGKPRHTFTLLRSFPTEVDYGTASSESSDLLKVSCTLIYDNYSYTPY
jgi:hypothetical protein